MCMNFALKNYEKNKNEVGRENQSRDDIEMAACDGCIRVYRLFDFLQYIFRI